MPLRASAHLRELCAHRRLGVAVRAGGESVPLALEVRGHSELIGVEGDQVAAVDTEICTVPLPWREAEYAESW